MSQGNKIISNCGSAEKAKDKGPGSRETQQISKACPEKTRVWLSTCRVDGNRIRHHLPKSLRASLPEGTITQDQKRMWPCRIKGHWFRTIHGQDTPESCSVPKEEICPNVLFRCSQEGNVKRRLSHGEAGMRRPRCCRERNLSSPVPGWAPVTACVPYSAFFQMGPKSACCHVSCPLCHHRAPGTRGQFTGCTRRRSHLQTPGRLPATVQTALTSTWHGPGRTLGVSPLGRGQNILLWGRTVNWIRGDRADSLISAAYRTPWLSAPRDVLPPFSWVGPRDQSRSFPGQNTCSFCQPPASRALLPPLCPAPGPWTCIRSKDAPLHPPPDSSSKWAFSISKK